MNARRRLLFTVIAITGISALLNLPVTTKQAVNYSVNTLSMPLYIKTIEFLDRDYHYRRIVRDITKGMASPEEKVIAIFDWCVTHVHHRPEGLPIVDDHPLNIVIRGYGVDDQLEDIFTILCTYAGYESFCRKFRINKDACSSFSFVKIRGRWTLLSVSNNARVMNGPSLASVEEVINNPSLLMPIKQGIPDLDAIRFIIGLKSTTFRATSTRVKGQSPFGRLSCLTSSLLK